MTKKIVPQRLLVNTQSDVRDDHVYDLEKCSRYFNTVFNVMIMKLEKYSVQIELIEQLMPQNCRAWKSTCEDAHCKIKSETLLVSQNCMLLVIVLDNKLTVYASPSSSQTAAVKLVAILI